MIVECFFDTKTLTRELSLASLTTLLKYFLSLRVWVKTSFFFYASTIKRSEANTLTI